jgi:hypothetical protein
LPTETDEINLFIAAHSDRWMFELPNRTRTTTLFVPPLPDSRTSVQLVARRSDAATGAVEELRRMHIPTRWSKGWRKPPPPVERWWRYAQVRGLHDLPYRWEGMEYAQYNLLE